MRKTAFVKISGDLLQRGDVLAWLRAQAEEYFLVLCVGGGTQINEAFNKREWEVKFTPLGRECNTFEQRQVARDILEQNQVETQDMLARERIPAMVIIPVIDIGSVLCHVNGDLFPKMAYLGYDRVFVLTLKERIRGKQEEYADLPKIEVVGF